MATAPKPIMASPTHRQAAYDLWTAEQKTKALIRKVKPLSAAALAGV